MKSGGTGWVFAIVYVLMSLALVIGVVAISEGQRRVPVQYPKRVVGRRVYGGQSTHIPIKVNQAVLVP